MQLHTGAPDTSWQQHTPRLGWHDTPLEPSRADHYMGASATSWQEHQRRAGATAGASGPRLHHMCPSMLCKNYARNQTLAFTVALLCCCPESQPPERSSPQAVPHAAPQAASQLHLYDVQGLTCVLNLGAYPVSQTRMSWPCCRQRLACRSGMQWTLQIRPSRSAISLSVVRPLSQAHTVNAFSLFQEQIQYLLRAYGPLPWDTSFDQAQAPGDV